MNTNYSYDSVSHLLSVLHQAGLNTLDGASYTYDAAGNRQSKTNYLNGVTSNYTYDPLYELTQVTQGASTTESYSYDAVGNRLSSLGVPNYNYNSSNELTSNSIGSYTYDANGNTLTDAQGRSFTWDFENRLTQVVNPKNMGTDGTFTGSSGICWTQKRGYVPSVPSSVYDQPGPLPWNFAGYYLSQKTLSKGWKQYLQYIQTHLNAAEGTNLSNKLGEFSWRPMVRYWTAIGTIRAALLTTFLTTCANPHLATREIPIGEIWGQTGRSPVLRGYAGHKNGGTSRLYECISEMKKGSASGYDAETGEESASSESALGEPYEQPSLYRIRRSQKSHQFLRQDRCGEIWGQTGRSPVLRGYAGHKNGGTSRLSPVRSIFLTR